MNGALQSLQRVEPGASANARLPARWAKRSGDSPRRIAAQRSLIGGKGWSTALSPIVTKLARRLD